MPSPILARADALMQRRRLNTEFDDVPVLTDAVDSDDDVPVLLDIAPLDITPLELEPADEPLCDPLPEPEPNSAVNSALSEPPPPSLEASVRDILAHELTRRIEQRLATELPKLIESTVRDFLAEQEMIAAMQPRE